MTVDAELLRRLGAVVIERDAALARVVEVETQCAALRAQLAEAMKLCELQQGDIDRFRAIIESSRPNRPERVPSETLQFVFEAVLQTFTPPPANDIPTGDDAAAPGAGGEAAPAPATGGEKGKGRRGGGGRRPLDLTKLAVHTVTVDPPEVLAARGEGFIRIGEETSDRVGRRRAEFIRIRTVRTKWVVDPTYNAAATSGAPDAAPRTVLVAPLPEWQWPHVMADASVVAHFAISKYDDCQPLHRMELRTTSDGFPIARSTQCGWLILGREYLYRIVDAMMDEALASAHCIATDATSAPVRARGACVNWHVFVFIADCDHVVFRYHRDHTSCAIASMLPGFRGCLLADAHVIYDALYEGGAIEEVGCWSHVRRYFWRALESARELALEALAIISKLFEVERDCATIPMPARTLARAARASPLLEVFDRWVARHRGGVDPRSPLSKALGYYDNQRAALHRFLADGRLPICNNVSERELRKLVLGRRNWTFFETEEGLRCFTTYRSLIASCRLHGLDARLYLEQVMRLAPHWPVTRALELSPKYWSATVAGLDDRARAIIAGPWGDATGALAVRAADADAA